MEADDLPELRSLAARMRRDLAAVINGLTLEHSSGAVEGNLTRLKRLKRYGYGQANFDLLKAQILIAACAQRHVIIARAKLQGRRHPGSGSRRQASSDGPITWISAEPTRRDLADEPILSATETASR